MIDHSIKITGICLSSWEPWENGDRVLAHIDAEVNGFALAGALLVKTRRGGFVFHMPRTQNHRGAIRSVNIIDSSLRHDVMDAARKAYIAFGGEGGEWTPTATAEVPDEEA